MQAGLREEELKWDEMEEALTAMNRLEKLVLGMTYDVSLSGLDD